MRERKKIYHQKLSTPNKKGISWLDRPLVAIALTILTVILAISFLDTLAQLRLSHKKLEEAQNEVDKQRQIETDLEQKLQNLNDPFYREKIIRDELNMQKPGEVILQLPSPSPTP
ncbi:MAG TPA: septum formation initiator family protein [Patescibacteria group bacterium]|nr:septum formation initiator family protein [Patescibacteria group bacterium]